MGTYNIRYYNLEYINHSNLDNFRENRNINVITKMLTDFVLQLASNNPIIYSNVELADRYNVHERSIQYILLQLETLGLITRHFSDEQRQKRTHIELHDKEVLKWITTTKYDEAYKTAVKRSPFRRFINQSVLFLKHYLEKSIEMYQKKRRDDKIAQFKARLKNYDKHLKYHQKRFHGHATVECLDVSKVEQATINQAVLNVAEHMLGYKPYRPPNNAKN